ncbi:MAG: hypothetical protein ACKO4T_11660 [Planctomycetaceae bacterium]
MIPLAVRRRMRRLVAAATIAVALAVALANLHAAAADLGAKIGRGDGPARPAAAAPTAAPKPDAKPDATPDPSDVLARLLPPRSDTFADWYAPLEPLYHCGEPRLLPTCVPPPPCHPALPPRPLDLVGMPGAPTCGPIYRGPCAPRTGSHDAGPHPRAHRVHDRLVDWFYTPRTPILP